MRQSTKYWLATGIVVFALLVPRIFSLDHFVSVDEPIWLHRSGNFFSAVMKGDFAGTFVNRTPGVITTWVESAAYRIVVPYYRVTQESQRTSYTIFELTLEELEIHPLDILQTARVLMVLFLSGVLLVAFYYAVRLFGLPLALLILLLLAYDPYFTALSRISHLDAPQAVLMFLSLLAFSAYLYAGGRRLDLIVSGAAGGMALLAKLPGILIVPTIGAFTALAFWKNLQEQDYSWRPLAWKWTKVFLGWSAAFVIAFVVVWPAMWVEPVESAGRVLLQTLHYSSKAGESLGFEEIDLSQWQPAEPQYTRTGPGFTARPINLDALTRYPSFFYSNATPVTLLGLVFFIGAILRGRKEYFDRQLLARLAGLLLLTLIYTVAMSLPSKGSPRYYGPVYLALIAVSGTGWFTAARFAAVRLKKQVLYRAILAAALVGQIWISVPHFPYYFTYVNPLKGGTARAASSSYIGYGEGLDQVGRYLSQKPDSEKLRVMSFYAYGPFSYFFDGKVFDIHYRYWLPELVETLERMDYLVIYSNQRYRGQPPELFDLLENVQPEFTAEIRGGEFAWAYRVDQIPLEDAPPPVSDPQGRP